MLNLSSRVSLRQLLTKTVRGCLFSLVIVIKILLQNHHRRTLLQVTLAMMIDVDWA